MDFDKGSFSEAEKRGRFWVRKMNPKMVPKTLPRDPISVYPSAKTVAGPGSVFGPPRTRQAPPRCLHPNARPLPAPNPPFHESTIHLPKNRCFGGLKNRTTTQISGAPDKLLELLVKLAYNPLRALCISVSRWTPIRHRRGTVALRFIRATHK